MAVERYRIWFNKDEPDRQKAWAVQGDGDSIPRLFPSVFSYMPTAFHSVKDFTPEGWAETSGELTVNDLGSAVIR